MDFFDIDARFRSPQLEMHRRQLLPPNTLTNSDGTPYAAGHDEHVQEKTLGQIAYEALVLHMAFQRHQAELLGHVVDPVRWEQLVPWERQIWEEVAQAVKEAK